ncbi:hypothetical protein [Mumia sp. Pv 4-285]|uniref:hypothetical protein n=1 Tax=Mumia qirimensis TaxID=3234852 RepID=UPI00351D7C37
MPRVLVLLLGLVVGVVGVVGTVVLVRAGIGSTNLAVSERTLACDGKGGDPEVCVVRLSRPELLVVPGRREIQVRRSGTTRALYAEDPFGEHTADGDLEVEIAGGVSVAGPSFTLLWDAAEVDSLLTD